MLGRRRFLLQLNSILLLEGRGTVKTTQEEPFTKGIALYWVHLLGTFQKPVEKERTLIWFQHLFTARNRFPFMQYSIFTQNNYMF